MPYHASVTLPAPLALDRFGEAHRCQAHVPGVSPGCGSAPSAAASGVWLWTLFRQRAILQLSCVMQQGKVRGRASAPPSWSDEGHAALPACCQQAEEVSTAVRAAAMVKAAAVSTAWSPPASVLDSIP